MKKTKYLLIILCLVLITGCKKTPKLADGSEVVAELNGKQISAEELYSSLKEQYGTSGLITLVDNYITEKEITDEISKEAKETAQNSYDSFYTQYKSSWESFLSQNGFKSNAEVLDYLEKNYRQNLILKKYLKTTITDEEIKDYYDKNIYGEITARHILISPDVTDESTADEKTAAEEAALNKAKELIETLKNSTDLENDFINLAKENSKDTGTASEGGLLENFTNESGLVEEFWKASLELENGKFTLEPVKTTYGYHIIYKKSQNEKPNLDTVKDKVINAIVDEDLKAENATYTYWAALREKYGLKISDTTINDNYNATLSQLNK